MNREDVAPLMRFVFTVAILASALAVCSHVSADPIIVVRFSGTVGTGAAGQDVAYPLSTETLEGKPVSIVLTYDAGQSGMGMNATTYSLTSGEFTIGTSTSYFAQLAELGNEIRVGKRAIGMGKNAQNGFSVEVGGKKKDPSATAFTSTNPDAVASGTLGASGTGEVWNTVDDRVTDASNGRGFQLSLVGDSLNSGDLPTTWDINDWDPATFVILWEGAFSGDTSNNIAVTGTIDDITVIPEPSTFALISLLTMGCIGWRWRKRKRLHRDAPEQRNPHAEERAGA